MMSSWLAENPELLKAALELVDTWDAVSDAASVPDDEPWASTSSDSGSDDAASTASTSRPNSPLAATVLPRLPKLVVTPTKVEAMGTAVGQRRRLQPSTLKSTHHRRREEISALSSEAVGLQRQVQSLKRTKRDACVKREANIGTAVDNTRMRIWRDMAQRQHQLRSAAEADQAKLRKRVDAQTAMAREMIKLVQKARRLENDTVMRSIKRQRILSTGAFHPHEIEQLLSIDEMYGNLDRFHAHPKFFDGTHKFIDIKMHEDWPQQFVIQVSEAWTVPFDEDRVMDALWQYSFKRQTEGLCAPEFLLDSKVHVEDAKLVSQFTALASIGSAQGNFDGRALVRRFTKTASSPPAIITSVCCSPSKSSPGDFMGVGNQGISSIRVLPSTAWKTDHPVSRVTYTERFTVRFEEDAHSRRHAGIISSMTLEKLKNNMKMMHETVETFLLTPRAH